MSSGHARRALVGLLAPLACLVACHEDVTSQLAFACRTNRDCAAGWVCATEPSGPRCVRSGDVADTQADTVQDEVTDGDAADTDTHTPEDTRVDDTNDTTPETNDATETADMGETLETLDSTETTETTEPTPTLCDELRAGTLTLAAPIPVDTTPIPVIASDFALDARTSTEHAVTVLEHDTDGTTSLVRHLDNRSQVIASGLEGLLYDLVELPDDGWVLVRSAPAGLVRVGATGDVNPLWLDRGLVSPMSIALLPTPDGLGLLVGDAGAELAWYVPAAWVRDGPDVFRPAIVATNLYMESHVAVARDGTYAAYASSVTGWVALQPLSPVGLFAELTRTPAFADVVPPPTTPSCAAMPEPCWNASGAPGRCELRSGVPLCVAARTALDPRVLACDGADVSAPCSVTYAGVTLDGQCSLSGEYPTRVLYCVLDAAAHDTVDACQGLTEGASCAFLMPPIQRDVFPTFNDRDADGLSDESELLWGTDPDDDDSDDDTWADGVEPFWNVDVDGDGLIAARDPDADGDGLPDSSDYVEPTPNQGTCVKAGDVGRPDVSASTLICANGYQGAVRRGMGMIGGLAVHPCGAIFYTEFTAFEPDQGSVWALAPGGVPVRLATGTNYQRLHFGDAASWAADTLYAIDRATGQVVGRRLTPATGPTP